jgi:RND family efflux transporter MFP subunit
MKKLFRRLLVLGAIASIGAAFYYGGSKYLWPAADNSKIAAVGMIEAPEVNITSRIAGRISQLNLIEGSTVEKGQVVARIEDVDLRNQLRKALADLEHYKATLDDAQRTASRDTKLASLGIISTQQNDDAFSKLSEARADVTSGEANVQYYKDLLKDTEIRSPIDGVVVNKALEVGEWVTPGTPILTVDDLSTIWARVDVQETDLAPIRVGEPATVTIPGFRPGYFSGSVMSIGQEGEFATEHDVRRGRQDIRTFYVKVRVLQSEGLLKPGMTAEVEFARHDGTRPKRD